jgi:hypothetical protein
MVLFKVRLTEEQIQAYKQPEGTRDPNCGGGINCVFCALKMLGVYGKSLAEKALTCAPRYREGNPISSDEHLTEIQSIIKDIFHEEHVFNFIHEAGRPREALEVLGKSLDIFEACYLIYGRSNDGAHAVVLRMGEDGILELIDPQRGLRDIGTPFGFTVERARELGIEMKPEFYRVRGSMIEDTIIDQCVLFGYWKSREELLAGVKDFVIGTLQVDSTVGMSMLIEDTAPSHHMEIDGGARTGSAALRWDRYMRTLTIPSNQKLNIEIFRKGVVATIEESLDWKDAILREMSYTTADDEEFVPKYEDFLEIDEEERPIVKRTELDEHGNPKMELEELEGGARKRSRAEFEETETAEKFKRTPEEKATAEKIIRETMKVGVEGLQAIDDTLFAIVKEFYKKQYRDLFEPSAVDTQCKGVFGGNRSVESEICWLCGFAQVAYATSDGKPFDPAEGGDPLDTGTITNEAELEKSVCEHKLPVKVAHFFQLMYSSFDKKYGQMDAKQYERKQKLYGTAHIICNTIKDNDRFLMSILGDKTFGEFTENSTVIRKHMTNLLSTVQKRASTNNHINEILVGDRHYYWGTIMMKQTTTGRSYYRNSLMYRIHKMEGFRTATSPYRSALPKVAVKDSSTLVQFSGQFTYPSNAAVKKWLDLQYTNIVGGLNELRTLLNSEKDTLYTEGVQVINRKPYSENQQWWNLVMPYVTEHPDQAEEFKHGLHSPFLDMIKSPIYKPIQRVWKLGDIEPMSSLAEVKVDGGGKGKGKGQRVIVVHI